MTRRRDRCERIAHRRPVRMRGAIKELARRHPARTVWLAFGAAAVLSVAARTLLGARGGLLPALLLMLMATAVGALFSGALLRGASDARLSGTNRRILAGAALLPGAFTLFAGWQLLTVAGDMALPFDERVVALAGGRYVSGYRGLGSYHLRTTEGDDYALPPLVAPPASLRPGRYRLGLSHLQHLVMDWEVLP